MGNPTSKPAAAAAAPPPSVIKRTYLNKKNTLKYTEHRIVQNFVLIWLDSTIDESQKDCQYTISQLRQIVNSITTSTNANDCQNFIRKIQNEQIFLIVSGKLGRTFVPIIHELPRIDSIYLFCGDPSKHSWTNEWKKIKLVTNQIELICKSLVKDTAQCEHDLIPTSILAASDSVNRDLQQIDQSFMYSQLLKEILLEMTYDDEALGILVDFCREQFAKNEKELEIIDEFARDYSKHTPIWWYTRECFTYRMLNRSLRTMDIDIIAMMGFFMKDIHQQLKDLCASRTDRRTPFRVYRGQGMPNADFESIRKNIGGLFAFNSFLSTSVELTVAMKFVPEMTSGKTRILFLMEIDPTIISTPFGLLNDLSFYRKKEDEILFSMHTIFRISRVQENKDEHLWQVTLESVSDNDVQITRLINQMRRDLGGGNAINRLGQLMLNIGELKKAEDLYGFLLTSTPTTDEKALALIYNQMGYIKSKQGDNTTAKSYYEKACQIQKKLRPTTDLDLATTYSNMGLLYTATGDSSQARSCHQEALKIREKLLDPNHLDLATTYNNIGLVCDQLQDYSTALMYYEKTLNIYKKSLAPNHPWLATIYKNIGIAQIALERRPIGLENLRTAMEIRKVTLPSNHPSIASICSTIGGVYREMGDNATALTFYEQALDVQKRVSQKNYRSLAMAYYDMSRAYHHLKQDNDAIRYAELAVQSASKSLSADDQDLIKMKNNFEQLRTKH